jgi:large subunit ribosomal protein L32
MAVPRSRLSNARKNIRRAHHAKKPKHMVQCSNCSTKKMPHCICQSCGYYDGRAIVAGDKTEE